MKLSLEIIALILSIGATIFGIVTWYTGAVQKRYASQRDFDHLKRSYSQLVSNLETLSKEFDRRFDSGDLELKEIKALMMTIIIKISPSELSTGFFRRQSGDES